ncbi:MAG TPA: hypothetical protein VJ698_22725 [Noviherbaspirillum sp.]|uniref:hypothetical protein n=1 Tax=Noviherbaspirillum sp. TaxID=1926288 RepID=UPI002B4712D6|nr:hypothetical protein [Noviherbaspirillum sp.]HJV88301.1 hypothetical protein [Noviherbaspirillum sp.]
MLNPTKSAATWIAVGVLIAALAACQKKEAASEAKGPAEKAGQQIDQAAARAGTELNKAAEKAGETMQQLGQKLENKAEQAQNSKQDTPPAEKKP